MLNLSLGLQGYAALVKEGQTAAALEEARAQQEECRVRDVTIACLQQEVDDAEKRVRTAREKASAAEAARDQDAESLKEATALQAEMKERLADAQQRERELSAALDAQSARMASAMADDF